MASRRKDKTRRLIFTAEQLLETRRREAGRDVGWCKMPRTFPYILNLLREKAVVGSMDCDRVLLELLARDYGDGVIETSDEAEHAFACGYCGTRGARTWRERVDKLVELAFFYTAAKNGRPHGFLLLRDFDLVMAELEERFGTHFPDLFKSYQRVRTDVGADENDGNDLLHAYAIAVAVDVVAARGPVPENIMAARPTATANPPRARKFRNLAVTTLTQYLAASPDDVVREIVSDVRQRAGAVDVSSVLIHLVGGDRWMRLRTPSPFSVPPQSPPPPPAPVAPELAPTALEPA